MRVVGKDHGVESGSHRIQLPVGSGLHAGLRSAASAQSRRHTAVSLGLRGQSGASGRFGL